MRTILIPIIALLVGGVIGYAINYYVNKQQMQRHKTTAEDIIKGATEQARLIEIQ